MRHDTAKFWSVLALTAVAFIGTACERAAEIAAPIEAQFARVNYHRAVTTTTASGSASKIIGASGDTLLITNAAGLHGIEVPSGAVNKPTQFTITFTGTGLDVSLQAVDPAIGQNVGAQGFRKPVTLCLNYSQVVTTNPRRLRIAQILPNGQLDVVRSTLHEQQKYICGDLQHFSEYTMAEN